MTNKRISFILSSLWLSGGVRVVVEYANRLTNRGYQVSLVTPAGTVDAGIRSEINADVALIESPVGRAQAMTPGHMAHLSWSLARAVPPSDVVIATHTPTTVAGLLAARFLRRGRPVWLCQDYAEMFAGRHVEGWLFRNAARWHAATLVVSGYSRNELSATRPGARIVVVGEGLSAYEVLQSVQPAHAVSNKEHRTILTMGDMRLRKGMNDLQQAVSLLHQSLPDIRVSVFFKEEGHLECEVPVESVFRPDRQQLAAMYANCDVFVSASWHESFGLPPLEAMACGAPVVLTDSGGVRDYARSEENCLMVPPRDPQALASAMLRVLTDPALANRLRRAGRLTAARLTWDAAVDRFEVALQAVMGEMHG